MVLEQAGRLLLIDCGLMFPDADMHGIDLVLPDFTYLREQRRPHRGVRRHPRPRGPRRRPLVPAARLLVPDLRLGPHPRPGRATASTRRACSTAPASCAVADGERRRIGPFDVEFIPVTHSVPHAHAIAVHTPQGVVLHSGDFKLDLTPVDGRLTDLARIGAIATTEGIRLLLADSTNAEHRGHAPSERDVGAVLRATFHAAEGRRVITTSFASHIHRIQQIADAAIDSGRVVATLGLSMKQERAAGPRARPAPHPRRRADRHRGDRRLPARAGVRDLDRAARASRCRRWRSWPPATTGGSR